MKILFGLIPVGMVILAGAVMTLPAMAKDGENSTIKVNVVGDLKGHNDEEQGEDVHSSVHAEASSTIRAGHDGDDQQKEQMESPTKEHATEIDENDTDADDEDIDMERDEETISTTSAAIRFSHPEEVGNQSELRSFAQHLLLQENHLQSVHTSTTTVDAELETPARFLGFIPTTITANVSISNDGSVTVEYPWYAFLWATHEGELKNKVRAFVGNSIPSNTASSTGTVTASTTVALTAQQQARLLNGIVSAFKDLFKQD